DCEPVARLPAAEPVYEGRSVAANEDDRGDDARRGCDQHRREVLDRLRRPVVRERHERRACERQRDGEREQRAHPASSTTSSRSTVPRSLWTSSASARISASTVTLTTMSVSV